MTQNTDPNQTPDPENQPAPNEEAPTTEVQEVKPEVSEAQQPQDTPPQDTPKVQDPNITPKHGHSQLILLSIIFVFTTILVGVIAFFLGRQSVSDNNSGDTNTGLPTDTTPKEEQVGCTLEAKICPDGTTVGREGPNCEFATCPTGPGETGNIPESSGSALMKPEEATMSANPTIPADWHTYTNSTYGFTISYPPTYQALDDADSLYGYPNGIVILYQGGQAYDIVIETWDTDQQYMSKYSTTIENLTINQVGDSLITINDNTQLPENQQITKSFQRLPPIN